MHATAPVRDRAEERRSPPTAAPVASRRPSARCSRCSGRSATARSPSCSRARRWRRRRRRPRACGRSCARARRTPTTATRPHRGAPDEPTRISDPTGGGDVELLQLKLNWHLSAMRRRGLIVDGDFGGATAKAVIAFKRFHKMKPANAVVDGATWAALDAAPQVVAPTGRSAKGPAPEYDRITEDGLLQITLAVGFDEHGLTPGEHHELRRGLEEVRGFTLDPTRAAELHDEAGRPPPAEGGELFVKENVATSLDQPVHCVLRLIGPAAPGEDGTASATAAALALDESEVFEYGGHARYGTGPDFDRNYTITVHWDQVPEHQRGSNTGDENMSSDRFMHAFAVGRQPPRHRDLRAHARGRAADLHRAPGGQPRHQPRAGHAPRHAGQPPDRPRHQGPAAAAGALGDRRPLPPVAVQRLRDQGVHERAAEVGERPDEHQAARRHHERRAALRHHPRRGAARLPRRRARPGGRPRARRPDGERAPAGRTTATAATASRTTARVCKQAP